MSAATSSTRARRCRTTGRTPTASSWPTTSSPVMYGPTFPEHLYTVAAQSNGVVDNKSNADTPGSYCDDPLEYTKKFKDHLSKRDVNDIMKLEDHITDEIPDQLIRIAQYWEDTRTCFNIKVLPDELEEAGVSWKYYGTPDQWMNGLQAIEHVRFGPMWKNVQDARPILKDLNDGTLPDGLVADPARGQRERASGRRRERLRRRELDRRARQRGHEVEVLEEHGDRDRLGRLRGLLRPRRRRRTTTSWAWGRARRRSSSRRTRVAGDNPDGGYDRPARCTSSPPCCGSSRSCTASTP